MACRGGRRGRNKGRRGGGYSSEPSPPTPEFRFGGSGRTGGAGAGGSWEPVSAKKTARVSSRGRKPTR